MGRLIKYYNLKQNEDGVEGTCYDGTWEFTTDLSERVYPDEYLIADILEKYIQQAAPHTDKRFFVIKEEWKGNGGSRKGDMNLAIADEILKVIDSNPSADALILAPFLYRYHHPGITIDLKNKVAIYLDPYGSEPYDIRDLQKLKSALLEKGFNFLVVKAEQQQRGKDVSSCGPIQTASMIKFINEFLETGFITTKFNAPSLTLATDRMVQMNIRNPKSLDKRSDSTVNEIGLADEDLWIIFFKEQGYEDKENIKVIIDVLKEQKKFIHGLLPNWENDKLACSKVESIIDFQSKLTNVVLKGESVEKITSPQTEKPQHRQADTEAHSPLSMMVLGGFIAAAGIGTMAVLFTVLNVKTLGLPGLAVATVGGAAALSGLGLFATAAYKNRPVNNGESTNVPDGIVFQ